VAGSGQCAAWIERTAVAEHPDVRILSNPRLLHTSSTSSGSRAMSMALQRHSKDERETRHDKASMCNPMAMQDFTLPHGSRTHTLAHNGAVGDDGTCEKCSPAQHRRLQF
jgi:hypothetical protein